MKEKFSAEFERRLFALEEAITIYRTTGENIDVFPLLFQCLIMCWVKKPVVKSEK